MTVRIGNGAGFLGDQLDAPRRLVEATELDYLTLEYLAELTMSILARQREKDPTAGFASDFLHVVASLCPALQSQSKLRIITNAGGVHPLACARAAAATLCSAQLSGDVIGVVTGDDLLSRVSELQQDGCDLVNLETGQPLAELFQPIVSANAYLGAPVITKALDAGARVVITGRVADASLTVGPAVHEFGWAWDDWNPLAAASVAGHLIECGAQVTGGYSTSWQGRDLANIGYPIAELAETGSAVITKPAGCGGTVNRQTVVEQLVYEIGDPRHYLTPDVDVDFTSVEVNEQGRNRVHVSGASGTAAPDSYKVSLAYRSGYAASATLVVWGSDAEEKAAACAEVVQRRLRAAGFQLARTNVELLGNGGAVPLPEDRTNDSEIVLRLAVQDERREAVQRFTQEIAPLITSGPAGLAGYAVGRSPVRPVYAYWPTLIPKACVSPSCEVRTAREWLP